MISYNFIDRLLHDIFLNYSFVKKSTFELEKFLFNYIFTEDFLSLSKKENHIFISSLPRSGTTSLLNYIYSGNEFASLTYRDMPFILAPNLSTKFNSQKKFFLPKLRFHNDGIYIDLDSPEAFDNVFFDVFSNSEIIEELPNYVALILNRYNKKRYLSKNNNLLNKIEIITKSLKNTIFLTPFRDPKTQCTSLFRQHKHFKKIHKDNKFSKRYMTFLGHEEFGFLHKPWNKSIKYKNTSDINYWLEQWVLYYEIALEISKNYANHYLVCYEKLIDINYLKKLNYITRTLNTETDFFKISQNVSEGDYDTYLLDRSNKLYIELMEASFMAFTNKNDE